MRLVGETTAGPGGEVVSIAHQLASVARQIRLELGEPTGWVRVEVVDAAGAPVATIEISESIAGLPGDLRLEVELWREAGVETSVSRVGSASPAATG
jgi:hypothetical protein